jgi:hypothetical protein
MWSNRSLRNYHNIVIVEYIPAVQTLYKCGPSNVFLWYLLWGLQVLDFQQHPGGQQHPGKQRRIEISEDLTKV